MLQDEKYLWFYLLSLLWGVFLLAIYDPSLRPEVLDFAKVALGGILTLLTAKANLS